VSTWLLPASPVAELIAASGMAPAGGKGKNFGFLALDDSLNAQLSEANRWDIAMADSDVF
jgi:hypothetical protein